MTIWPMRMAGGDDIAVDVVALASALAQGTGDNGSTMGYLYQDKVNTSFSHTAVFVDDALSRLTSAVATGSSQYSYTFSYDRYGNMTCTPSNGQCATLSYNTGTNRITSSGYTYDAAGNLTADGVHTYQYNGEGRLLSVDNGATMTFGYNALEER
ncbi:MAG: hypothetical protein ACRD3T_20460, partial [Terriglobia bacterium]